MKSIYFIVTVFFLLYSVSYADKSTNSLENLVLCQQNDIVIELAEKIHNGDEFEKEGAHFYKPKKPMKAFGYEVVYVGLAGVDMVPGPNISVKGKFSDVEKSVKAIHNGNFNCGPGGCDSQVDEYLHVMIYKHPTNKDLTIIQCGYFGQ